MAAYIIAQITIADRETYAVYEAGFMDIFNRFDGKLLSVDEAADIVEGAWNCTRSILAEFPSKTEAMAWYNCADYQKLATHRHAASTGNIALIQGLE